ncbi:hypothetical protein PHG31p62 [Aeromonas phage 31]|uniref:Uncharacterized protein n=4 Tax=Biquartavirus TaxID=1912143 RepID=Q6U9N9_9CAUD|nr:hypothetical protein ST44RRORF063c [Aeromonas phage 44RR2.8t]YP_238791.1 hypothetical protein PHG31p62 [Aeromonas phage 31]APU00535.1 hypothetical protein [Aeromonas phage 44RR2.8t.2]APU00956.1 hypothetical protein [Aeromonas phage 31.2]APU01867.1 hypothetical protein [Aeromonas phage L9-6]APU02117.1 hypothetical protein [Aeromonas phage Riv-10]APU02364.1 hypothetical protein [Aeromonas phage SW69-9]UYD59625.1 hypothetical protein JNMOADIG_00096 [Aeromonas phage avDM5]UYD60401.1 hypothet
MARSDVLVEKAKELQKLLIEVNDLASENNYGVQINSDNSIEFDDWLSSSCYGEGDEAFNIESDGSVWMSSSC